MSTYAKKGGGVKPPPPPLGHYPETLYVSDVRITPMAPVDYNADDTIDGYEDGDTVATYQLVCVSRVRHEVKVSLEVIP